MDFGEAADGGKVLGRDAQNVFELGPGLVEPAHLEQRAPERDAGRHVGGMPLEPGLAGRDGFIEPPRPPVFLGERRERDGRRVHLDPASQFLDAGAFSHPRPLLYTGPAGSVPPYGVTVTVCDSVDDRPASSRTVSVMV